MSAGIYVLQDNGTLVALAQSPYDTEDVLQTLLADYPDLLAGDQISPSSARRWLLVRREFPVPGRDDLIARWSLDHLFLDQDGVPTLVEVKRSTDSRIRREVVGQMLDYAANAVVYWPIEELRHQFESRCRALGRAADDVLAEFLGATADVATFWSAVKTNLQAGRVRMLFVADVIPDELRRIIEFLNEQMDPAEVLGVEVRQFVGGSLKTLVPRVIGQTAEADTRKKASATRTRHWDEASFMAEMERKGGPGLVEVARQILRWIEPRVSRIWWGTGATAGSFVPVLEHEGVRHQLFNMHTGWGDTRPAIDTQFSFQANKPPFDAVERRLDLLRRFNEIPGVMLPDDAINRRPPIPLSVFEPPAAREKLFETLEWYIAQVRRSG